MVQIDIMTDHTSQALMDRANQRLQDLQAEGCAIQDVQFRYVGLEGDVLSPSSSPAMGVMICYDTPPRQG